MSVTVMSAVVYLSSFTLHFYTMDSHNPHVIAKITEARVVEVTHQGYKTRKRQEWGLKPEKYGSGVLDLRSFSFNV